MKIVIKKKLQTIEEARTFEDATTNIGKYKKKLINKLRTLEKEQPEQLADEIIENMKNSIEEKVEWEGKNYTLPDGERVAVFDWLKNLTINNTNNLIGMLGKGELEDNIKTVIAHFILSKKFTPVKSVSEFEDLIDLDTATGDAWWQWKEAEKIKREKESLRSSDQNIEKLTSSNPNWEILIPHDRQASIYLGQICSSHWCTAARSEDNMFSTYYKKDDPLFVIKHKTSKETAEVKNPQTHEMEKISVPIMFQVHFGSEQFKNRKDLEVSEETRKLLLDLIQNSKTEDANSIQEKYPVVENMKMQETEEGLMMFVKNKYGDQEWSLNGERHRIDGPAVIESDGTKMWYQYGKRHREDGPAEEVENGTKRWYRDDQLHREDGPAEIYPNGTEEWYLYGKHHREGGPAVEWPDGSKNWYRHGELHREDGPAVEWPNGSKRWYLNDRFIASTDKNDVSTPQKFIKAGGKEWDWKNDPWSKIGKPLEMDWGDDISLQEHFRRFSVLWGHK